MARYRAKHPIFIGASLYQVGEEFESDLPPGRNWEPLDDEAKAAVAKANHKPEPKLPGQHNTPLVEIPENWTSLKGFDLINLAKKLGLPKNGKADDARALIEKELAARSLKTAA